MAGGITRGELLVHGTCIAMGTAGVLLRGAPGSGKSDLALRFLSLFGVQGRGNQRARLIADDQVLVSCKGLGLAARSPAAIEGQLEVRGIGIVKVPYRKQALLTLIVDLVGARDVPRMAPEPWPREDFLGVQIPVLKLDPFDNSCPVKLKLALTGRL